VKEAYDVGQPAIARKKKIARNDESVAVRKDSQRRDTRHKSGQKYAPITNRNTNEKEEKKKNKKKKNQQERLLRRNSLRTPGKNAAMLKDDMPPQFQFGIRP